MTRFYPSIWAITAICYILFIFTLSRQTITAPTGQRNSEIVSDAEMELAAAAARKLEAYLRLEDNGTTEVIPPDLWPAAWQVFNTFRAFNFDELEETCGDVGINLALSLNDVRDLQNTVGTETFKRIPDYGTQAWDWFFMKNNDDNPKGWARNPNTFQAWRAIRRNIQTMRDTPRVGFNGKGIDLVATKNQVHVLCGQGLGNTNCDRGAFAFVIDPERNGAVTRWELHLCGKFFTTAQSAKTMLRLMNRDDPEPRYLSQLQTTDVILIHEFGHMWNFGYVDGFAPYDPIDPDVPCRLKDNGKVYGAECAWKLAWVNQRPKGQEFYERPNVEVATCCESYAWWHNKRYFDLNDFNVPLNYKLIPGGGIPHDAVIDGPTRNFTTGTVTWNSSMTEPRRVRRGRLPHDLDG